MKNAPPEATVSGGERFLKALFCVLPGGARKRAEPFEKFLGIFKGHFSKSPLNGGALT